MLILMNSPNMDSWLDLQYTSICFSQWNRPYIYNKNAFGSYHSIHAPTAPMSITCHGAIIVLHGTHSWMELLMTHFPQQPRKLSGTVKANQQ